MSQLLENIDKNNSIDTEGQADIVMLSDKKETNKNFIAIMTLKLKDN